MNEPGTLPFWKEELLANAKVLRRLYVAWDGGMEAEFELEKCLASGCYFSRKIVEAGFASKEHLSKIIQVTQYARRKEDEIEWSKEKQWFEAYDFFEGAQSPLTRRKICDQVIHSKLLSGFTMVGDNIFGILFASDHFWKKHVNYIPMVRMIEIYESVAKDKDVNLKVEFIESRRARIIEDTSP